MKRSITQEELAKIVKLAESGKSDTEIAAELGWNEKLTDPERAVAKQRYKLGLKKRGPDSPLKDNKLKTKLLELMTKDERYEFIKSSIDSNPRNRLVFQSFSHEEKLCFLDQYYSVIQSTESINEAEEQQLFAAIVEYVLAFRSLRLKSEEELCVEETLRGEHDKDDPRYRLSVHKSFNEEYNTHLKNYQDLFEQLKLSRKQRLDRIRTDSKKTLVDLALELSTTSIQALAADEIEKLSLARDEELKKMIEEKTILGNFGDIKS